MDNHTKKNYSKLQCFEQYQIIILEKKSTYIQVGIKCLTLLKKIEHILPLL